MRELPRAFRIRAEDNVATLLDDVLAPSQIRVLGASPKGDLNALERISLGHKIALRNIATNDPIIKFGVTIGTATQPILAGQWVHLHNCRSNFDERSQTLELHTGAATDTRYE
jgi:hypothetical protein